MVSVDVKHHVHYFADYDDTGSFGSRLAGLDQLV